MTDKDKEYYKKKIERCEKLGAIKFQKIVFKVEKLKYKIIKKIFPKYQTRLEKIIDKEYKKAIKKASSSEERQEIKKKYQKRKVMSRKEIVNESNLNYHINQNNPQEFKKYLNYNKGVHKRGLIKNAIIGSLSLTGCILGIAPVISIPLLAIESLGAVKNFQCVNLQNYNLYRLEEKKEKLERISKRREEQNLERYGKGSELIAKKLSEQNDASLPTIKEIAEEAIKTGNQEALKSIRELITSTLASRGEVRKQSNQKVL